MSYVIRLLLADYGGNDKMTKKNENLGVGQFCPPIALCDGGWNPWGAGGTKGNKCPVFLRLPIFKSME